MDIWWQEIVNGQHTTVKQSNGGNFIQQTATIKQEPSDSQPATLDDLDNIGVTELIPMTSDLKAEFDCLKDELQYQPRRNGTGNVEVATECNWSNVDLSTSSSSNVLADYHVLNAWINS